MKTHAIIPIFIPHRGCPNDCVFCNQKIITARSADVTFEDAKNIIETHLSTLKDMDLHSLEVAFFGGSFTGIPMEEQEGFLKVAYEYKKNGIVDGIHLSTRPDYINEEILDLMEKYEVSAIELGCQSFDEEVLALSKRGHKEADIYEACRIIKERGIKLGIQLMIGLPGDTKEKAIESAKKAAAIKPELARLYPTVILPETELACMYKNASYIPPTENEMLDITTEMYKVLFDADIKIMRVGLKSTDLVTTDTDMGKGYHPAFRQLVEGKVILEEVEKAMSDIDMSSIRYATVFANGKWINNLIGHKGCNKKYLANKYQNTAFWYKIDESLMDGKVRIETRTK